MASRATIKAIVIKIDRCWLRDAPVDGSVDGWLSIEKINVAPTRIEVTLPAWVADLKMLRSLRVSYQPDGGDTRPLGRSGSDGGSESGHEFFLRTPYQDVCET